MIKRILLCICILLCIIPIVSAINMTASVGETWIIYRWETGYTTNIYIDSELAAANSTFREWYLTDINSNEKHQIQLYNSSEPAQKLGSLTATTLNSQNIIYLLICVLIAFVLILLLRPDPIKQLIIGALAASLSLYTYQFSIGYGGLSLIPIIIVVIAGIFIAIALWEIIIEKTKW